MRSMVLIFLITLVGCTHNSTTVIVDRKIEGPKVIALDAPRTPWVVEIETRLRQSGFQVMRWASQRRVRERVTESRTEEFQEAATRYVLVIDGFAPLEPKGSPLKAHESTSTKIVSLAQSIYQESGAPPAHVSICFSPSASLKDLNREQTARLLATFVHNLGLTCWQRVDMHPEDFEYSQFPEQISFLHALGVPNYGMAHWAVARAGWVAPLDIEALQARIAEKSAKLDEYRKVTAENWLVVTSDGTKPSQMFNAPPDFDPSVIISPFSRTFYYGYPDRVLIELGSSCCSLPAHPGPLPPGARERSR